MNRIENHYGITVHSTNLKVVGISNSENGFFLELIDEIRFNESLDLKSENTVKLLAVLQSAFDTISFNNKLFAQSASFTLPAYLFLTANLPFDNTLLQHDLIDEFLWEFSVLYPFTKTDDLVIRHFETTKNNFLQNNIAIVAALDRKYIVMLKELCKKNNLNLKFVDNSHFASDRALNLCRPKSISGFTISFYFEDQFLSASVNLDGKPVCFRNFDLKEKFLSVKEIMHSILESTSPKIKEELIEKCFIAGDQIPDAIIESLKDYFEFEPEFFNPFEKIAPVKTVVEKELYRQKNFSFSSPAGIAFRIA